MAKFVFLALIALSGVGLGLQAAVNARLRAAVGSPALSALISFGVGSLLLAVLTLTRVLGPNRLAGVEGAPWWIWLGGLFGAFVVMTAILGIPKVGAGGVIAATVFGQLLAAMALDTFGWMGVPRTPLTLWRAVGAVLLFVGGLLIQRK